jgi:hypothetical protein
MDFLTPNGISNQDCEYVPVGVTDNRKAASTEGQYQSLHHAILKLSMKFVMADGEAKWFQGTGAIAKFNNPENNIKDKYFILTCAHNLFRKKVSSELASPKELWCTFQDGLPGAQCFRLYDWSTPPDYKKKSPTGDYEGGVDLGIIKIPDGMHKDLGQASGLNLKCVVVDPNVCQSVNLAKQEVVVSGYPVDGKFGKNSKKQEYDEGRIVEEGQWVPGKQPDDEEEYMATTGVKDKMTFHYKIHTSGGQSGSPVVKKSQSGKTWMVVGVHCVALKGRQQNGATSLKSASVKFLKDKLAKY